MEFLREPSWVPCCFQSEEPLWLLECATDIINIVVWQASTNITYSLGCFVFLAFLILLCAYNVRWFFFSFLIWASYGSTNFFFFKYVYNKTNNFSVTNIQLVLILLIQTVIITFTQQPTACSSKHTPAHHWIITKPFTNLLMETSNTSATKQHTNKHFMLSC